jgi:hypothetical protein
VGTETNALQVWRLSVPVNSDLIQTALIEAGKKIPQPAAKKCGQRFSALTASKPRGKLPKKCLVDLFSKAHRFPSRRALRSPRDLRPRLPEAAPPLLVVSSPEATGSVGRNTDNDTTA